MVLCALVHAKPEQVLITAKPDITSEFISKRVVVGGICGYISGETSKNHREI